jgi:toxin ParE1/3/4
MQKIRLSPEAAEELEQAAIWYENEAQGLGARFIDTFENALTLLKEDYSPLIPLDGEAGSRGAKRIILHRFPFSLIVLPQKHEMIILALAHHSRKPAYWLDRLNT